jgi:hypothetical protein
MGLIGSLPRAIFRVPVSLTDLFAQIVEPQDGSSPSRGRPQAVSENLRDFASFEKPIVVQCGKWPKFSVK